VALISEFCGTGTLACDWVFANCQWLIAKGYFWIHFFPAGVKAIKKRECASREGLEAKS
jgi:hypothetical protein